MKNSPLLPPTFADVEVARQRIAGFVHSTPVITSRAFDEKTGCKVFFKCENLQKTGSFKVRGAINAVSQLSDEELARGVVTHSSGNHAAALSYAAKQFKTVAHIVMPANSSPIKMAAVRSYGGRIIECESTLAARLETAAKVQAETNAIMIPPFDHPHIIAGQATCAREFLEQCPGLDMLIVPIGGGGLMSGTCLTAKHLSPAIEIVGAEPAGADDAFQSKVQKRFVPQENPQTIADGLRTSLGELTWPFIRDQVDLIVRVEEPEILTALQFFNERTKLIIEPSSAVAVAALLSMGLNLNPQPIQIGVILSGGNVETSVRI